MIPILGEPDESLAAGLTGVMGRAVATGAESPPWLLVQDRAGQWLHLGAARPWSERRRGLVAVADERGLAAAIRLGIGGAVWMPASTASMAEAMRAAARPVSTETAEGDGLAAVECLVAAGTPWHAVGLVWIDFWRAQLGPSTVTDFLSRLAAELGAQGVMVPGPAMVLAGPPAAEIERAWHALAGGEGSLPLDSLAIAAGADTAGTTGWSSALSEALAALETRNAPPGEPGWSPRPVAALPGGATLGHWATCAGAGLPAKGWLARPEPDGAVWRWRLESDGAGAGEVVEVLAADELPTVGAADAARVPGWASLGARPGTPQGLLVARLARAASRHGLPLWVPNVDDQALRLLMTLDAELWVDGPAVPG